MQLIGQPYPLYRLAKHSPVQNTEKGQNRLRMLKAWQAIRDQGVSSPQASKCLGLSRATLYRWQARLNNKGPGGLEELSRRPKHLRCPHWEVKLVETIRELRQLYPRWGKEKLVVLLKAEGFTPTPSTVGRILTDLKHRNLLPLVLKKGVQWHKRRSLRLHAIRKPREYPVSLPGDLVQVDTLDINPLPGWHCKHFTARDVVSRWDVIEVYSNASSFSAKQFLMSLLKRMPFPVRAVQVDGGSEFKAHFERACQQLNLKLFVLPPRSPKLNGFVERAHRTHIEEFYQIYDYGLDLVSLNLVLSDWERIYNRVRPHRSLDNLTPQQYIHLHYPQFDPNLSHMY
jgi:putative transposase